MKLLKLHAENFGSYKELDLDFDGMGLCLLHGATGAGKSTIADMAYWTLFGMTAKGGNVDEVRSWQNPDEATKVRLVLRLGQVSEISVTRIRGRSNQNDLYWSTSEDADRLHRGKDLADTQKLLVSTLGFDSDSYVASAYFNEFAQTGSFFSTSSKVQRSIFERVANLDTAIKLAESTSDARKRCKSEMAGQQDAAAREGGRMEGARSARDSAKESYEEWKKTQERLIAQIQQKHQGFEKDKEAKIAETQLLIKRWDEEKDNKIDYWLAEIDAHTKKQAPGVNYDLKLADLKETLQGITNEVCPTCKSPTTAMKRFSVETEISKFKTEKVLQDGLLTKIEELKKALKRESQGENPYINQLESASKQENSWDATLKREMAKANPFAAQMKKFATELKASEALVSKYAAGLKTLQMRFSALNRLYDLSFDLRGELVRNAVRVIEASTNKYLETYFDSEIRVSFELSGSDSISVGIQKSGYDCVYRQLSKGQRGLLKLAFVVSIMKVAADKSGQHFENLFFDEALDGLDSDLKVKAFSLFEELEQGRASVLLIDHAPEFQNLFGKRYHVELVGDVSQLTEEA